MRSQKENIKMKKKKEARIKTVGNENNSRNQIRQPNKGDSFVFKRINKAGNRNQSNILRSIYF